jgi:PelA/Pel-15E family pectate lyase
LDLLNDFLGGMLPDPGIDDAFRQELRAAYDRGIACVLATQKVIDGQRTVWGQQHSHGNPQGIVGARSHELPSLTGLESVRTVKTLMAIDDPSEAVKTAIRSAIHWFATHRMVGVRYVTIPAEPKMFTWRFSDVDRVVVASGKDAWLWSRHYDVAEQRPIFFNSAGERFRDFARLPRSLRGSASFGTWPQELLDKDYPAWRAKHDPDYDAMADIGPGISYQGTILDKVPKFGAPEGYAK